jgi:hypothetical protein
MKVAQHFSAGFAFIYRTVPIGTIDKYSITTSHED